jgi:hypothetical protein
LKDPKLQAIMANLNSSRPVNLEAVSTCFNRGFRMFYGCFTDFFTDVFWIFKFMDIYGCLWMFIDVYGCIWLMVCGGDAVAAALLPTFRT